MKSDTRITIPCSFTCYCCGKTSDGIRINRVVQYKGNPPGLPVEIKWDGTSKEGENNVVYFRKAEKLPDGWFQIEWYDSEDITVDRYACSMECVSEV